VTPNRGPLKPGCGRRSTTRGPDPNDHMRRARRQTGVRRAHCPCCVWSSPPRASHVTAETLRATGTTSPLSNPASAIRSVHCSPDAREADATTGKRPRRRPGVARSVTQRARVIRGRFTSRRLRGRDAVRDGYRFARRLRGDHTTQFIGRARDVKTDTTAGGTTTTTTTTYLAERQRSTTGHQERRRHRRRRIARARRRLGARIECR
jgi:hypothetical protein